ncbi:hypothetical protein J2X01_000718 [Arthrobacter ginsengisoli]|uniref:Uncharacterized protein n=1 Tax=Arthrobacter ginsengisoli TaxID=1356565 RepID=A0ABU1U8D4_9MICC|nr:hypothetical protein [Arthrobacter ginsengisoli]
MPLTRENIEVGQVGHVLRSILTGIESREVSGKRVPRVPKPRNSALEAAK